MQTDIVQIGLTDQGEIIFSLYNNHIGTRQDYPKSNGFIYTKERGIYTELITNLKYFSDHIAFLIKVAKKRGVILTLCYIEEKMKYTTGKFSPNPIHYIVPVPIDDRIEV